MTEEREQEHKEKRINVMPPRSLPEGELAPPTTRVYHRLDEFSIQLSLEDLINLITRFGGLDNPPPPLPNLHATAE